jgi:hypothetical protein
MDEPSELQQLRQILLAPEVSALASLEQALDRLQHQIHDPEKLSNLLAPIVADVVRRGDPTLSRAIIKAITPHLDRALREKVIQDVHGISNALAPASTAAIAAHFASDPRAAAQDLGPLMGAAIKEQIRGERDAMIDALYPVIGSTISKYLSETLATLVRTINERIESRLSLRSLQLKMRSLFTGVSEAELLLRESLPLSIEAAFLIHKSSGLVIAQAQNPNAAALDPDLLSGMLTAIRNLFNDSMNVPGTAKELDQIEYGESKIVLEVAGYCYLAAVVRGIPDNRLRTLLRTTLSSIVEQHGEAIATFSGHSDAVPESVRGTVRDLVDRPSSLRESQRTRRPYGVMAAGALLLLLVCTPFFVYLYRNHVDRQKEAGISGALLATRSSSLRDIVVDVDRNTVHLTGHAPNEYQRQRAGEIASRVSGGLTIDNVIIVGDASPFPVLLASRVGEIVTALNTVNGIYIESQFQDGSLILAGVAADSSLLEKITRSFEQLPGLETFVNRVNAVDMEVTRRLLFKTNSTVIRPGDQQVPAVVKSILDQTPWSRLLIIGHSDEVGGEPVNRRIATGRAAAARAALLKLGVRPDRMRIEAEPGPPPGETSSGADSLNRCVRFVLLPSELGGLK